MSNFLFLNGNKRGEYLVVLQFVLLFAFVATPIWNPFEIRPLLDALALPRWLALMTFGSVAMLFGVMGAVHLRNYLTPLPYPVEHSQLVQHGVYNWVRHPLYASQLFIAGGWVLYSFSLSHLLLLIIGFIFFDYKASKEEAWLTERHPEYADYAKRVRKFVPFVY